MVSMTCRNKASTPRVDTRDDDCQSSNLSPPKTEKGKDDDEIASEWHPWLFPDATGFAALPKYLERQRG